MIKKKMKLHKVLALQKEVLEMMKEKISFASKYKLNKLLFVLSGEMDDFTKVRDEAIRKLGVEKKAEEEGAPSDYFIDDTCPRWNEFLKEIGVLMDEDIDFEHKKLTLDDFEAVNSDKVYSVLFDLISE